MKSIEFYSALLTIVIAIVTTYIMVQQFRLEKRNYRYQLFEHRHKIYEATMLFIAEVIRDVSVNKLALHEYMISTRDSMIFFEDDISDYINDLYKRAVRLRLCDVKIEKLPAGEERNKYVDEDYVLLEYFAEQHTLCKTKFSPYLNFKKP